MIIDTSSDTCTWQRKTITWSSMLCFFPAEKPSFASGIFQHATFNYHMVTVIVEINDKVDN